MALCLRKSQPLSGSPFIPIIERRGMISRPLRPKASKALTLGWKIGPTVSRCSVATCQVSRNVSIDELPVHLLGECLGPIVAVAGEAVRGHLGRQVRRARHRRRVGRRASPAPRSGRASPRPVSARGCARRRSSPGKALADELRQPAFEIVGQGVVRAYEQPFARARSGGDLGAAMPAHIEEGAEAPSLPRTTRIGTPLRSSAR